MGRLKQQIKSTRFETQIETLETEKLLLHLSSNTTTSPFSDSLWIHFFFLKNWFWWDNVYAYLIKEHVIEQFKHVNSKSSKYEQMCTVPYLTKWWLLPCRQWGVSCELQISSLSIPRFYISKNVAYNHHNKNKSTKRGCCINFTWVSNMKFT